MTKNKDNNFPAEVVNQFRAAHRKLLDAFSSEDRLMPKVVEADDGPGRIIKVWCDAPMHAPVMVGALVALADGGREFWEAVTDGLLRPRVDEQDVADADVLGRLLIARLVRFRCSECGLDIQAGDRLGGILAAPGLNVLSGADNSDAWERRLTNSWATAARLSALADNDVSRLSLSTFGRILQM